MCAEMDHIIVIHAEINLKVTETLQISDQNLIFLNHEPRNE